MLVVQPRLTTSPFPPCDHAVASKKAFRNPSIYEQLVTRFNLNETGTNCQSDQYDPSRWVKEEDYAGALDRLQKEFREKRAKLRAERAQQQSQGILPVPLGHSGGAPRVAPRPPLLPPPAKLAKIEPDPASSKEQENRRAQQKAEVLKRVQKLAALGKKL